MRSGQRARNYPATIPREIARGSSTAGVPRNFFMISTWSFKFTATERRKDERPAGRGRGAFSQLAAEPGRSLSLPRVLWPGCRLYRWINEIEIRWIQSRVFALSPSSRGRRGRSLARSLSWLSLLRENRCRAGGQPTGVLIEYIKHTAERRRVRGVNVHASVSLHMNVLK